MTITDISDAVLGLAALARSGNAGAVRGALRAMPARLAAAIAFDLALVLGDSDALDGVTDALLMSCAG